MKNFAIVLMAMLGCSRPSAETEEAAPSSVVLTEDTGVAVERVEVPVEEERSEPEKGVAHVRTVPASVVLEGFARQEEEDRIRRGYLPVPIDAQELRERTIEALLRVTVSEEGWANETGMKAIWQVARQLRGCLDAHNNHVSCRDPRSTGRRAPPLTGLWRFAPRAVGTLPPNRRRGEWISTLTEDCTEPSGWPETTPQGTPYAQWVSYVGHCKRLVELAREIVDGTDTVEACPPRSRPIAWGCSPQRRRAIREVLGRNRPVNGCDDTWIAERRGLQRLDCGETENAFYCRPGTPHCGSVPESERILAARDAENMGS